jgi:hypothetical protein
MPGGPLDARDTVAAGVPSIRGVPMMLGSTADARNTLEERPFQGRVEIQEFERALAPRGPRPSPTPQRMLA